MTREEVRKLILSAKTLEECVVAKAALLAYVQEHPDDDDIRTEGGGLRMLQSALELIAAQEKKAERVA
jgi:hypothetical protein